MVLDGAIEPLPSVGHGRAGAHGEQFERAERPSIIHVASPVQCARPGTEGNEWASRSPVGKGMNARDLKYRSQMQTMLKTRGNHCLSTCPIASLPCLWLFASVDGKIQSCQPNIEHTAVRRCTHTSHYAHAHRWRGPWSWLTCAHSTRRSPETVTGGEPTHPCTNTHRSHT